MPSSLPPCLLSALLVGAFACRDKGADGASDRERKPAPTARGGPRLLVLIVIDQLPSWSFERSIPHLEGGLGRLVREGILYSKAELPYGNTFTASDGWTFGAVGAWLQEYQEPLMRVLGLLTIGLGLLFAGWLPRWLPGVDGSRTIAVRPAAGLAGAPLLGVVFGLGWTACTGPTLAAILALAGLGGDATRGALLATAYCLGLGIPFVLTALAYRRALGAFAVARRHRLAIARAGGVMLIVVGLLLVSGVWADLLTRVQGGIAGFETAI